LDAPPSHPRLSTQFQMSQVFTAGVGLPCTLSDNASDQ